MVDHIKQVLEDGETKKSEIDGLLVIGRSAHIPKVQSVIAEFFDQNVTNIIDPGEAASVGATLQGDRLTWSGAISCTFDVPEVSLLSLGIETTGGIFTKIVSRYTVLPTYKSEIFTTSFDNQSTALIQVFQGGCPMSKDNNLVGRFALTGIPPAPSGVPQIQVSVNLDENRFLKVVASHKDTGRIASLEITNYDGHLDDWDIQRLMLEVDDCLEMERKSPTGNVGTFDGLEKYALRLRNPTEGDEPPINTMDEFVDISNDDNMKSQHDEL